MAFADIRFPDDIAYGSTGGPEYSTTIVTTQAGHEYRNRNWQQARARYNVASGVKTAAQLEELIAFFRARQGQAEAFRYKDWCDFQAMGALLGAGDGATTDYPLRKAYSSGTQTVWRLISKPVPETVSVYLDSVLQLSGWQLDGLTGIVQFDTPPAANVQVKADFEFDVPVRFATDWLNTELHDYRAYRARNIPLIEVME